MHGLRALWRKFWPLNYRYPALDIQLGSRQLHLVGSIHMGTDNMTPLPQILLDQLQRADALIVETDITTGVSPFNDSGRCQPLAKRLPEGLLRQLHQFCRELGINIGYIDALPAWQVALMLQAQQAQRLGLRSDSGIDYQLLQAAREQQKKIIELEGPDVQLAMLKALPDNGMPLLEDTLQHWNTNARLLQTMVSWWLETPPNRARKQGLPTTFNNSLNDLLMHKRNQHWNQLLRQLPAGRYVVAVGALHLYGTSNLPALLRQR